MEKIFVTGSCGFIGAHVVRRLIKQKKDVSVLLRERSDLARIKDAINDVTVYRGDLLNEEHVARRSMDKVQPDALVHLGWQGVDAAGRNDPQIGRRNLEGSYRLFKAAVDCGCKRIVTIGSQAEYGVQDARLSESHPIQPLTEYAKAKVELLNRTQELLSRNVSQTSLVWLRLFAAYGPMDSLDRLIPYVIHSLLDGQTPIVSAGDQKCDYLYIDDVVDAVSQCLEAKGDSTRGVFNLCSGTSVSVKEIVVKLQLLINRSIELRFGERHTSACDPSLLLGDNSRLRQSLNWHPSISLEEGLARTVFWYKSERSKLFFERS